MNGDIGFIRSLGASDVTVDFQQTSVTLATKDMHDLQLAYAVSIHKFQGSEAPIIILPIVPEWQFFMTTDVLYTAVTRAKHHVVIVGNMEVLNRMVCHSKKTKRLTRLFQ